MIQIIRDFRNPPPLYFRKSGMGFQKKFTQFTQKKNI